jgi:hypothetical protein
LDRRRVRTTTPGAFYTHTTSPLEAPREQG